MVDKFFYVAEQTMNAKGEWVCKLIKRYKTFVGAEAYLHMKLNRWYEEGLKVKTHRFNSDIYGLTATDENGIVVYNYTILSTPIFIDGGFVND